MDVTVNQPRLTTLSAQMDKSGLLSSLFKLFIIGLITQLIYLIYIVAFPLISNTLAGGPAADVEILMRGYRWFAPLYALGLIGLYYLFWQAMRLVQSIQAGQSDLGHPIKQVEPSTDALSMTITSRSE